MLALHLKANGIPFIVEHRFHSVRKWRYDFCLNNRLLVDIDGGIWIQGHHSRGKGMEDDFEKMWEAVLLGYRVMKFSTGQVKSGVAIETIRRAMK